MMYERAYGISSVKSKVGEGEDRSTGDDTGGPVSLAISPSVWSPKQVWIGPSSSHVVCLRPRLLSGCSRSGGSAKPLPLMP